MKYHLLTNYTYLTGDIIKNINENKFQFSNTDTNNLHVQYSAVVINDLMIDSATICIILLWKGVAHIILQQKYYCIFSISIIQIQILCVGVKQIRI